MSPLCRLRAVRFAYPGSDHRVLDGVDLEIWAGETVLLTGASGCGKSTLALCLAGMIPTIIPGAFDGEAQILGTNLDGSSYPFVGRIGVVFQDPDTQIFQLDVWNEVVSGCRNMNLSPQEIERRCRAALASLHSLDLADRRIAELSGGQRQRVTIASILAMDPDLIILDEPTSALDGSIIVELVAMLAELRACRPTMPPTGSGFSAGGSFSKFPSSPSAGSHTASSCW